MVNDHLILRAFLAANSGITTLTSTRIYAGREYPVEAWKPADGSCLVFKRRGKPPTDESGQFLRFSYQFKCFGGGANDNAQLINAEALYRALYDVLQFGGSASGTYDIMGAQEEGGGGMPLLEEDTNWPYTLSFFAVQMRKTA